LRISTVSPLSVSDYLLGDNCQIITPIWFSGERVASQMRRDLFASIMRQDIEFFDSHKSGEIVSRLTSDVQEFKSSFKHVVSQGLRSLTQVSFKTEYKSQQL
jgi:ABC-type multidrug transport system fused ATPase/permease subunit